MGPAAAEGGGQVRGAAWRCAAGGAARAASDGEECGASQGGEHGSCRARVSSHPAQRVRAGARPFSSKPQQDAEKRRRRRRQQQQQQQQQWRRRCFSLCAAVVSPGRPRGWRCCWRARASICGRRVEKELGPGRLCHPHAAPPRHGAAAQARAAGLRGGQHAAVEQEHCREVEGGQVCGHAHCGDLPPPQPRQQQAVDGLLLCPCGARGAGAAGVHAAAEGGAALWVLHHA